MEENHINGIGNGEIEPANGHEEVKPPVLPSAKLKDVVVSPYMKECLDKVAVSEGFKNYDVKVVHGSSIGDGFVGIMFKVTIRENESDKTLDLVLKSPPDNYAIKHDFGAMVMFEREIFLYNVLLPEFVKFQEEKKISQSNGFFNFPKCYFAEYSEERDDAIIIMEDLREIGYKMWNKFVPTDYEHTKLVMASLGRLHAISFALKAQKPELFATLKVSDIMTEKLMDENFVKMMVSSIERGAAVLDENDLKRRNRILKLTENLVQKLRDSVDPNLCEPFAVITHGDCWSNNFMYKYKRGSPETMIHLDWQISRYSSPVTDLSYFFFSCTDQAMRTKHYDELLSIYHRSLKDLLDHLGGDTMTQFPFTALLRQLKKFAKFGVMLSFFVVPMVTTFAADLPDMDFMAENMNNEDPAIMEQMMQSMGTNEIYAPRILGVIQDAIRYGYV